MENYARNPYALQKVNTACLAIAVLVLYGVYFSYELIFQSNARFPRDSAENLVMYDGSAADNLNRYAFPLWWSLQMHHLFGLGIFLIAMVYSVVLVNPRGSGFCVALVSGVGILGSLVIVAAIVDYMIECYYTTDCAAFLKYDGGSWNILLSQKRGILIYYIIMAAVLGGLGFFVYFSFGEVMTRLSLTKEKERARNDEELESLLEGDKYIKFRTNPYDYQRKWTILIAFFLFIAYGVYFYYEMFVQSNIRFPRASERATMYEGASDGWDRMQDVGWWALQTHQLYGLAIVWLAVLYFVVIVFQGASAAFLYISVFFFIVFLLASGFGLVWYLSECVSDTRCLAFLYVNGGASFNILQSQRLQIPIFYSIMLVFLILALVVSISFCSTVAEVDTSKKKSKALTANIFAAAPRIVTRNERQTYKYQQQQDLIFNTQPVPSSDAFTAYAYADNTHGEFKRILAHKWRTTRSSTLDSLAAAAAAEASKNK